MSTRFLLAAFCTLSVLAGAVAYALHAGEAENHLANNEEHNNVIKTAPTQAAATVARPPIDLAVPDKIETATFAMG